MNKKQHLVSVRRDLANVFSSNTEGNMFILHNAVYELVNLLEEVIDELDEVKVTANLCEEELGRISTGN